MGPGPGDSGVVAIAAPQQRYAEKGEGDNAADRPRGAGEAPMRCRTGRDPTVAAKDRFDGATEDS